MPRETAAERKARIRARLAEDQKPTHAILAPPPKPETPTANAVTPEDNDDEQEDSGRSEPANKSRISAPSSRAIADRAISRRQSKPTNYKIHVVTALALTLTIRILALGPKAAIGGK